MIGNNNDDYDDYLNDDTITIPLSCEDEDQDQEQEKNLFYRKWLSIKMKIHFSGIYTKYPACLVLLLFYC